jgi:hypothetical protein
MDTVPDVPTVPLSDVSNTEVLNSVINVNVHMNCIIIKSHDPNVPSKAVIVTSYGGPLSDDQRAEIIIRERAKMFPVPEVSEVSEVPEVPEVSEVSEVPEVPEVSEVSEVPEVSEVSEVSEVPEVPEVSEVSDAL